MKKLLSLSLVLLLVLSMSFSMSSCSPTAPDVEEILEEWAADNDAQYATVEGANCKELIKGLNEYGYNIKSDTVVNNIIACYTAEEEMTIFFFDNLADAWLFEHTDIKELDEEEQDWIEEDDVIFIRRGSVVFVGSKALVEDFMIEVPYLDIAI